MDDVKIQAYLRAFSRLVIIQPGTPDFNIEQATLDQLWESLDTDEKAVAHEQAAPFRARLIKK